VASGSVDGSVYIWDALTGKVAKILKEHGFFSFSFPFFFPNQFEINIKIF